MWIIFLGHELKIYNDHKYFLLTFNAHRLLRWIIIPEVHGTVIDYIPGKKNKLADALSQLPNDGNQKTT